MMEFRIHYRGWPDDGKSQATTGSITVTSEQVQIRTRQSLVSAKLYVWLLLLTVVLFFVLVPLGLFFGWVIHSTPLPAWVRFLFPWALMVPSLAIFIGVIPIYHRRIILLRNSIIACHVHTRELLLQTAETQYVITAQTTIDAQALAGAVQDGAAISLPISFGRESLLDGSGFNHLQPVALAIDGSEITLTGRAMLSNGNLLASILVVVGGILLPIPILSAFMTPLPEWAIWVFLACCIGGMMLFAVIISKTKRLVRTLALSSLCQIFVIHHFVTFLASDDTQRERRYTLQLPSPEEAQTLDRRLRGEDDAPVSIMVKPANYSKNDTDLLHLLRPRTAEGSIRSGRITLDKDSITLTGRTGLAHPWVWRLAAAFAVLIAIVIVPVFSRLATPLHLAGRELMLISWVPAAMVALLAVYLPASGLLSRLLEGRISLPRTRLTHLTRLGREVSCRIAGPTSQYLTLVFGTDIEAEYFLEAVRL